MARLQNLLGRTSSLSIPAACTVRFGQVSLSLFYRALPRSDEGSIVTATAQETTPEIEAEGEEPSRSKGKGKRGPTIGV